MAIVEIVPMYIGKGNWQGSLLVSSFPGMPRKPLDAPVVDLTQAVGLLVRRVRAASAPNEMSVTESVVMSRLARDGPATTAELARAEGMKPQSMGAIIAALEARGIVGRTPHPTDGRQIHITLTAGGAVLRQGAKDAKHTWLAQAVARLDKEEQATLFAAGEIMRRLAEE
jgi:DNA-binding MarR family transcriptional regulator